MTRIQSSLPVTAILVLCVAAFSITACKGGGAARKRDDSGHIIPTLAEQDPAGTLYAASIGKAARGECDEETLDVLTCFAYRGHGYEGAQTALGQCTIATGQKAEGVEWVRRAADSGWPDAQKLLARLYLTGEAVGQDTVEAAKWAKLYSRNPSLLSLGVQPDRALAEEFRGRVSDEQNAIADQRVAAWVPKYWTPSTSADRNVKQSCDVEGRRPPQRREVPLESMPNPY